MRLCEICEVETAIVSCQKCKRSICKQCASNQGNICLLCAGSICTICQTNLAGRACNICGKLVCGACSIKEGEATICKQCHKPQG